MLQGVRVHVEGGGEPCTWLCAGRTSYLFMGLRIRKSTMGGPRFLTNTTITTRGTISKPASISICELKIDTSLRQGVLFTVIGMVISTKATRDKVPYSLSRNRRLHFWRKRIERARYVRVGSVLPRYGG